MEIYIGVLLTISVFLVSLTNFNNGYEKKDKQSQKVITLVLSFAFAFLLFMQTFRAISVGGDLEESYYGLYRFIGKNNITTIIKSYPHYEIGYILLNKIVYIISGGNIHALLFVIAAFFLFSLFKYIRRDSSNRIFSLFIFFSLGMFNTSMNNLRSTLAISFILLSLSCYFRKKYFETLVLFIAAFFFHRTILVFALFFSISLIKKHKIRLILYIVLFVVLLFGYSLFQMFINRFFPTYNGYFEVNSDGGYNLLFVLLLFFCLLVLFCKKEIFKNDISNKMVQMLICAICFQLISIRIPFFARVTFYFMYSLVLLIPEVVANIKYKGAQPLVIFAFCFSLFAFYIFVLKGDGSHTVPFVFDFK